MSGLGSIDSRWKVLCSRHIYENALTVPLRSGLIPSCNFSAGDLESDILPGARIQRTSHPTPAIDKTYHQEQIFFGVYGRDPLLFRQARLTENRILLLLARYSLRDLGRFMAIAFGSLVTAVAVAVMLHYTVLERFKYAATTNDWIDIERPGGQE